MTRPPLTFATAAFRVFDLALGQMLWSRRTVFMVLVVGGPVVIAVILRVLLALDLPVFMTRYQGNEIDMSGVTVFGLMIWGFYLRFTVPVLGVFYGTALIADEVEDKTITYLFTRPIPRGAVLAGKYLAYLACTVFVVLPSVMVVFFLVVPTAAVAAGFVALVTDLGLLGLGLAVYGAVFALIGAWFRRPLLSGLVFVFGWEPVVVALPGYMKQFTVAYYLQGLVPHTMPQSSALSMLQSVFQAFQETQSVWASLFWLALIWLAALALAVRVVERREYVLEQ